MSLMLCNGTDPDQLYTKTHPGLTLGQKGGVVVIGDYRLSMEDFVSLVEYALINTDLERGDPRRELVKRIKGLVEVKGYNRRRKRFEFADAVQELGLLPAGQKPRKARKSPTKNVRKSRN